MENRKAFLQIIQQAIDNNTFVKLTLSKSQNKSAELRNVYIRPVLIRGSAMLSVTHRYTHRDEVKNISPEACIPVLEQWLEKYFYVANLLTLQADYEWLSNKKGNARLLKREATQTQLPDLQHDKSKKRLLNPQLGHWYHLGVTDRKGAVLPSMQHKFKQVGKYIEILQPLLEPFQQKKSLKIVDMGAGKGYLTFALHEYLAANMGAQIEITGVEQRKELVSQSNLIVQQAGLAGLRFVHGKIGDYPLIDVDVLIALHACDTATDDAIAAGMLAGAGLIVCAPCCHKQIRNEITASAESHPVLKYGILLERQAEMLTDTLRALIMEKNGYKTHIQEFVDVGHTPKNLLLTGIKSLKHPDQHLTAEKIVKLKQHYGIKTHYLETLLGA